MPAEPVPPGERLIGSLCSGYGGLDLGVQTVLGGRLAWHADTDPGASKILARHWPGVPNLGDISTVDWATVAGVCVLTAGFPCQRRLGRRSPGRAVRGHPVRSVAPRRPRHQRPPTLSGGDRECPGAPHLPRRPRLWRAGTLPVVSGRPCRSACCAGTRCRTRIPGRPRVRCALARASRLRRRRTPPPRAGLPHRLAPRC
ncbi:DNA methyltransferase [Streptomyces sp. SID5473]|nr:DNA methyltransferase [Streptomyces tsukubensis]MYS67833.1 DNA methyltransferase [Streptomyces sp. SID5473]TAI42073.1 DNA methyltransferase [Streptomyces tsukubensis]